MSYYTGDAYGYRGDYYRGDYYRGDPGLFSFVGKALGGVAKLGVNVVRAQLGLPAPAPQFPGINVRPFAPPQTGLINIGGQGPQTGLFNFGGGGGGGGGGVMQPTNGGAPIMRGYHWNKTTYETRGGGTSRWGGAGNLQIHPKHSTMVKNRRMNWANGRAMAHAERRVRAFIRHATRYIRWASPHKKGHAVPKLKAKKR